jgi:hypothetical protein
MSRKELDFRIQLFDGVFRLRETGVNGVERLVQELDIKNEEALREEIARMSSGEVAVTMNPEALGLLMMIMSNPDAALRYGCDLVLKGWINMPDDPPEFIETPDPDPAGGVHIEIPVSVPEEVAQKLGQTVLAGQR